MCLGTPAVLLFPRYFHVFLDHNRPRQCAIWLLLCGVQPVTSLIAEFLGAIRSVNPAGKWKILVVDEHSQKLLGSVLKQFDILEENVTRMFYQRSRCYVTAHLSGSQ